MIAPVTVPPASDAQADPDGDIVRLAQRRVTRRAAMGVLFERYRERVFNTALGIVRDRDDAADVLQDVFVTLFNHVHRFRPESSFAAWVYRITVNTSLKHLRRSKRRRGIGLGPADLKSPAGCPEQRFAQRDLERHVQQAMDTLPDNLRITVLLHYLEGLAYAEIAEILDCAIGTVKSRLSRARAALRERLARRYGRPATMAS